MTEPHAYDLTAALRVGLLLLGVTAVTAMTVHFAAATDARELLGLSLGGAPRRLETAVSVFANNARVLGGVLAACLVVQLRHAAGTGLERALLDAMRVICDVALIVICALNVLLIGAAFGAYGGRIIEPTLAHGPFELAAFSLALGLYVSARRERLSRRVLATGSLTALATLALAALLEAFA